jgi:hypothetical protein
MNIPTDSNGIYSLPDGYLAMTGETATATQHNSPLEDLASAMSARMPRNGAAPMTAPLKASDGSAAAPSYTFNSNTGTGAYLDADGSSYDISINGTKVVKVSSAGITVTGTLGSTGDFAVNTNKFTVTGSNGNTAIAGTLGVTGNVAVNTNKFTVAASSGNTAIAGTFSVTGATSLAGLSTSGNASVGGTLTVTGQLKSSGNVVQIVDATPYTSNATLSTGIPYDDTIPTSSEGDQILSASITPSSSSNTVRIRFNGFGTTSGSGAVCIAAVFRGTTCVYVLATGSNSVQANMGFTFLDAPATTSSTTYSIRVGSITGTSGIRMNGDFSSRLFGGKAACTMRLEEVQA